MNANLYARFQTRFPDDADAVFLEANGKPVLRYGEIDNASGKVATLLKNCGVKPGDRVAVQVEKSVSNVVLYLACLRSGAIFLPLNTAYTAQEVTYFLSDAAPTVFVCRAEAEAEMTALAAEHGVGTVLTLDRDGDGSLTARAAECDADTEVVDRAPDDLASILYTSGTTGKPKGAMLSHDNLASNAAVLVDYWQFTAEDVLLHALPIFHVHGLFVGLHCALYSGSKILFESRYDASRAVDLIPQATVMMGVPTFYTRLLEEDALSPDLCEKMRLFISGSAPLLEETHRAFEGRTGQRILERYGMTEVGMATSNPYDGNRVAGTVGFALPGVTVRVATEDGAVLKADEVGVLEIKGPNVFKGYWQMPEKTAEEFRADGYFISGDIATMDSEGRVSIVGRAKDLIISGGYNVYPKEIELKIDDLDGVGESAVIGVPHPDFGEAVVAIVTRNGEGLSEEALVAQLAGELAKFKQPKRVFFVDELPRNTMGKVQKNVLRDTHKGLFSN